MRKKIIAGNWKMNKTVEESAVLAAEIKKAVQDSGLAAKVEVVACPTFIALDRVAQVLKGSGIALGAQDVHHEGQGAFTGKVSADMLKALGVEYVIIGHSEQRTHFHETDHTVNLKVKKAMSAGLKPIICVGETLEEREGNSTESVVEKQVRAAFEGLSSADAGLCVIAYEPVWAIGTGRNATVEQAQEVHAFIRSLLASLYESATADSIRIQYGGSMKPDNAKGLLAQPDVDGGLIGGAALKADGFLNIISAA